jgi:hypothetical protein
VDDVDRGRDVEAVAVVQHDAPGMLETGFMIEPVKLQGEPGEAVLGEIVRGGRRDLDHRVRLVGVREDPHDPAFRLERQAERVQLGGHRRPRFVCGIGDPSLEPVVLGHRLPPHCDGRQYIIAPRNVARAGDNGAHQSGRPGRRTGRACNRPSQFADFA